MTAHAWLDLLGAFWLAVFVLATVFAKQGARHWKQLADVHETRAKETAERAEDRERDEWQNGYREGWHDREAQK